MVQTIEFLAVPKATLGKFGGGGGGKVMPQLVPHWGDGFRSMGTGGGDAHPDQKHYLMEQKHLFFCLGFNLSIVLSRIPMTRIAP